MPQETIEFIIHPDGSVEERTLGLLGEACLQATAGLEAALGEVLTRQPTAEHYQVEGQDGAHQHRLDQG